ncbi:MAG TPA: hypothetical protein VIV57_17215 [Anaeromyxobacter sp.]
MLVPLPQTSTPRFLCHAQPRRTYFFPFLTDDEIARLAPHEHRNKPAIAWRVLR